MTQRSDAPSDGPTATVLPRGVRRALDAMRADPGRMLDVAQLAAAAGVSARTLQRQFQTFLGETPLAALRNIRFDCARRELLRGSPRLTVSDVARRCGFAHLGRFSVGYRRRYGELPSQTLNRQVFFIEAQSPGPRLHSLSPDHPLIAVVGFEGGGDNVASAREAADELVAALTRSGLAVSYRPESARYHLVGTLRGENARTRLTLRLIEAATGRHLWAHRTDGDTGNAFVFEEHVATRIVAAMQPSLRVAEIERARRKPDCDLTAHDLALRALPFVLALDVEGNARGLDLLERAMDRDCDHALSVALAAWCHMQRVVYHFTDTPAEARKEATALVGRASSLGGDATVSAILGHALTLLRDLGGADLVIRKALSLDGGSAWAWSRSGWIDAYSGRSDGWRPWCPDCSSC